ncbi:MAG TPA: hypothetical protein VMS64_33345 [Candidatus Methylomirabilis sp.]|nr:hypothetical protein [Candidatus Methylomirabilis sp.]
MPSASRKKVVFPDASAGIPVRSGKKVAYLLRPPLDRALAHAEVLRDFVERLPVFDNLQEGEPPE